MAAAGVRSLDLSASAALQGRARVLEPQNSRDLLLVSVCFILPFLSRMILAPLWRGFPFWQVELIGAPPNCFDAEPHRRASDNAVRHPAECASVPPDPTQLLQKAHSCDRHQIASAMAELERVLAE
jgi:hypothetical protein